MGLRDWFRRGAPAKAAHTEGGQFLDLLTSGSMASTGAQRVAAQQLVRRYGRWVHRCVTLNAKTAAAIQPRLFTVGRPSLVRKMTGLGAQPVDRRMKALILGHAGIEISNTAKAHVAGNVDDLTEITKNHPLLDLLNNVNKWEEGFSYREQVYADLDIFGQSFTHLILTNANVPAEMWRMLPRQMSVHKHPVEFIDYFEQQIGTVKVRREVDEILWFRLPDPDNPWGAYGPLEAWLSEIDADFAMAAFQDALFKRFGSPDWLLIAKAGYGKTQRDAFRLDWRRMFGRTAARRESIAVISADAELKKLWQTPRELEFPKSKEAVRDSIAQAFGVPKALLTSDDVNLANAREGSITYLRNEIWPKVRRVEDRMNQRLVPRFGDNLVLIHDNPMPEEREQIRLEAESMIRTGHSIDEVRLHRGEEALGTPEAMVPLVQTGVVTLEHAVKPPPPPPTFGPTPPRDDDQPTGDAGDGDKAQTTQFPNSHPHPVRLAKGHAAEHEEHFAGNPNPDFIDDLAKVMRGFIGAIIERVEIEKAGPISAHDLPLVKDFIDLKAFSEEALRRWISEIDIEEWIAAVGSTAEKHILGIYLKSGQTALDGLPTSISFDLQNTRVVEAVEQSSFRLANSSVATFRDSVTAELRTGIQAGESIGELTGRLRGLQGADLVRWKAEQIARTETGLSQIDATREGWRQSGVVTGYRFVIAPDACEWCQAVNAEFKGKARGLDEPLVDIGGELHADIPLADGTVKRQSRPVTYAPVFSKVHPNCRCSIEPVLESE